MELFDAADRLVAEGHLSEACPKYEESYRLDPQLGALLHLADCLEQDKRLASAYAAFREASEVAQKKRDERQALADERSRALAPRLSRLTVDVPAESRVPGLEVTRDGITLSPGSWGTAIPVDAGEHKLTARATGYVTWEGSVSVAGDAANARIALPPLQRDGGLEAAANPSPGGDRASVDQPDRGKTQRTLGFVAGGVGVLGLGVGAYFMVQRGSHLDERDGICPTGHCAAGSGDASQRRIDALTEDARSAQTLGSVALVGGGLFLAAGVTLLLTAPSSSSTERAAWAFVPVLEPGRCGVVTRGEF